MVYNCSVCPASTRDDSATTFSAVRLPSRRLCDDFLGRPPTLPTTLRRLSRPSAYPPDDSATTFSAVRLPSRRLCDDFLGRPPTLPTTLRRLSRPSAYPPDDSATTFSAVRLPSRRLCDDFLGRPPTLPTTLRRLSRPSAYPPDDSERPAPVRTSQHLVPSSYFSGATLPVRRRACVEGLPGRRSKEHVSPYATPSGERCHPLDSPAPATRLSDSCRTKHLGHGVVLPCSAM